MPTTPSGHIPRHVRTLAPASGRGVDGTEARSPPKPPVGEGLARPAPFRDSYRDLSQDLTTLTLLGNAQSPPPRLHPAGEGQEPHQEQHRRRFQAPHRTEQRTL